MRPHRRAEGVRAWLAVALWTFLVWRLSADPFSATTTSRFLVPLLEWLFPELDRQGFLMLHFLVRKGAHLFIYAVLGALALRAWRVTGGLPAWGQAVAALLLVVGTASADELGQSASRFRTGSPTDVAIDTAGGILGVAAMLGWQRRRALRSRSPRGGTPDA